MKAIVLGAAVLAVALRGAASAAPLQRSDSTTLTLASAVDRALLFHPGARAGEADVDRATAQTSEARATRFPKLSIEATGTRFQEPMIVAPLHGFDPTTPPEFDPTIMQGRAYANWLLFDGGARGSRIDRSDAALQAAESGRVQSRQSVIEAVVRTYVGVRSARELFAAHHAQVEALEAERARAGRMFDAGSVARVDVLRADAALSRARAEEAVRESAVHQVEADLSRLIGSTLDSVVTSRFEAVSVASASATPQRGTVLALATRSNAAVERARAQLAAAEAGAAEARAAWWPTLALTAGYNGYGSGGGTGIAEWQAGLQVSYPLFTGGARSAAVHRSEAEIELARQSVRQAELDAATAVDRALGDLVAAQAQAGALRVAVDQFAAVVDVEALSLSAGAGVQSDYLRAVSDLLDARAALTNALASEVRARIALARLTGELSASWLADNLEMPR